MPKTYEYKFVRLESKRSWLMGTTPAPSVYEGYQETVREHAKEGWRFVQIVPGIGYPSVVRYFELIFEREVLEGTA